MVTALQDHTVVTPWAQHVCPSPPHPQWVMFNPTTTELPEDSSQKRQLRNAPFQLSSTQPLSWALAASMPWIMPVFSHSHVLNELLPPNSTPCPSVQCPHGCRWVLSHLSSWTTWHLEHLTHPCQGGDDAGFHTVYVFKERFLGPLLWLSRWSCSRAGCKWQGLGQAKATSQEVCLRLPHGCRDLSAGASSAAFPCLSGGSQLRSGLPTGDAAITMLHNASLELRLILYSDCSTISFYF